tara:strand:- start:1954 stop:2286 length:333 start_codon:yes stop_codon:yes gene_type:complete
MQRGKKYNRSEANSSPIAEPSVGAVSLKRNKTMRKLGNRNFLLLNMGAGSGDYVTGFHLYCEEVYVNQYDELLAFCEWVEEGRISEFENTRAFGSANYEERFAQFKKRNK